MKLFMNKHNRVYMDVMLISYCARVDRTRNLEAYSQISDRYRDVLDSSQEQRTCTGEHAEYLED